jgi:hypothetical protein
MAVADGPFGASDTGVGFSDVALIGVSVAGFCILASIVYSIILLRLQTRSEFEKQKAELDNYDDLLEQRDVATLNRAQRRARAKNIMKRQRRIATEPVLPEADADALVAVVQQDQNNIEDDDAGTTGGNLQQQHLSRKERQKAAREAEKAERQLFQEERRLQQKESLQLAQEKKRERQEMQNKKTEFERKQRLLDREHQERAAYEQWRTFLVSESERMTVVEFIQHVQEHKTANLMTLSERFRVPIDKVQARVKELVSTCRITGIVTEDFNFIYITQEEMDKVASFILDSQEGTLKNLASEMTNLIATTSAS